MCFSKNGDPSSTSDAVVEARSSWFPDPCYALALIRSMQQPLWPENPWSCEFQSHTWNLWKVTYISLWHKEMHLCKVSAEAEIQAPPSEFKEGSTWEQHLLLGIPYFQTFRRTDCDIGWPSCPQLLTSGWSAKIITRLSEQSQGETKSEAEVDWSWFKFSFDHNKGSFPDTNKGKLTNTKPQFH